MHEVYMKRAIELAKKGYVSPNPRVGAVLVKEDTIIAEGYHKQFGGAHAEIEIFNSLPENFNYQDTILYISLEPCSHYGKTPPCVEKIISLGIKNVYIACLDPNPIVTGKGVEALEKANVSVHIGVLDKEAKLLNEVLFKFIKTKKPFILLKSAISLDGKICTVTGKSQWISSEKSRKEVQYLRSQYTAIMIGVNTVLVDNPMLNSRIANGRNPIRIILDTTLRTPISSKLVNTAKDIRTIIITTNSDTIAHEPYLNNFVQIIVVPKKNDKIDLNYTIDMLGMMDIDSILLEGGADITYSALEEKIIDKIQLYIAPIILGGNAKSFVGGKGVEELKDAFKLSHYLLRTIDNDIVLEGYIK